MKVAYLKLFFVFTILLPFTFPAHAQANGTEIEATPISATSERVKISDSLYILEDKNKALSFTDVLNGDASQQFIRNQQGTPNFGYTSSAYWAQFKIKNTSETTERLLEIAYPPLNKIDIYVLNEAGMMEEVHMGAKDPFDKRLVAHPNYLHVFTMETGETLTFFIRFDTKGSMQMPITIWEHQEFIEKRQNEILLTGIFYGILAGLGLYNLFLFFVLRHKSYLYYVLVVVCTMLTNLSLSGIAFQYFWPELPWWNMRSIVFFMGVAAIFALLFTNSFLNLKKNAPKANKILRWILGLNFFVTISVFFSYTFALNLMVVAMTSMILFVFVTALMSWKRGVRQARFFILAWFIFLTGVLLSILADSAIIPLTPLTRSINQITAAMEGILLSFALADRINILQAQKNAAVKKAQDSQLLAVENLKRSDALKDEFLAVTSHELRTPLYGMIGIAESLKAGVTGTISSSMASQLELIITSGERLMNLVGELLDLSKLKHGAVEIRLQPIQLKDLVDTILPVCKPLVKDQAIVLRNEVPEGFPPVRADQERLMQMLYNLIGNAIKFTESGEVVIAAALNDTHCTISVEDTGLGMTEMQMQMVFEPFQQQSHSSSTAGTGIGLNITKYLAELHGGKLAVKSVAGVGTTFTLTLPLNGENGESVESGLGTGTVFYVEKEQTHLQTMVPSTIDEMKNGKILIADDEPVNVQVLMNQLTMAGYEVITASNGQEALQYANDMHPDLVILDIMMPNMSGYEVCAQLRQKFSLTEMPVLMLTAQNQLHDKLASFEAEANDYLTKPCEKEELLSRVNTLITLRKKTKELNELNASLEQKVAERTWALEASNSSIARANEDLKRMENARSQLLSTITHELGTPLTLIQSYLQAVQEGLIEKNHPHYLEIIHKRLNGLERLTRDLFEVAKLESGGFKYDFQFVDVNEWFKQVVHTIEYDVQQSGRTFSHPQTLPIGIERYDSLFIDRLRMDQVLTNIVWNSIKYTDEQEGKIEMIVRINIDNSRVDTLGQREEAKIVIQLKDNGKGIAEENVPKVFERYFQAAVSSEEKESRGTGLGLAIAKEIIDTHNGKIWVESMLNEGTSIYVELPLFMRNTMDQEWEL